MRRNVAILALVLVASAPSCATFGGGSDLKKFMEVEQSYTFALNQLSALREQGKLSDDAYRLIDPSIQEAKRIRRLIHNQLAVDPKAKIKVEYVDALFRVAEEMTLAYYKNKEG